MKRRSDGGTAEVLTEGVTGNLEGTRPAAGGAWRAIALLSLAEALAMGVWFSATAAVPALSAEWGLDAGGRAWLTMAVQAGFVSGALVSAMLNLPDRVRAPHLIAWSAGLAAASTAAITMAGADLPAVLLLRFASGAFLAGVYPVGMKLIATWTRENRGLGIGLMVGALTLGSAFPHLLGALVQIRDWRSLLVIASALAVLGGLISRFWVTEGPFRKPVPPFDWRYVGVIFRRRGLVLANLGYLGHMWELYAMWAWIPFFLAASYAARGVGARWAGASAFAVIGAGGIGSVLAGMWADKAGRTTVTIASLAVSGLCSVLAGVLFGAAPLWTFLLCFAWGAAVVADSAQFSACISELADERYMGTALTVQTSLGFLLTLVTIRVLPDLQSRVGWEWAFAFLAAGPAVGIAAMVWLRRSPEARMLAGGRR